MPPIPELEAIRKKQILEAGLITIAQKGSANVTMDDICKAAGLSKGGLVHYYKTKKMLFKAVFREFFNNIFKRSSAIMAQYDAPLDQLLSFEELYDANDPEAKIAYPLVFDLLSLAVHDEEYRSLVQEWIENWVTLLSKAAQEGIDTGVFIKMDTDAVARSISAVYQGIATRWFFDREHHSTQWAIDSYKKGIMGILSPYLK
ncbi:MAG: hypothetical protein DRH26_09245 [Deltaproteobacteria bacterium]|nr:MAG: hypothetical protein DRH26_09245 [Deltaproteobacteria bacterium]